MKPVFFAELCHVTVVPVLTQKGAFDFEFGMEGVTVAAVPPLRFRSTTHGFAVDPQRFDGVQMLAGFVSEQTNLLECLFCALATKKLATDNDNKNPQTHRPSLDGLFTARNLLTKSVQEPRNRWRSTTLFVSAGLMPVDYVGELPRILAELEF
jgi:hypothetical protein